MHISLGGVLWLRASRLARSICAAVSLIATLLMAAPLPAFAASPSARAAPLAHDYSTAEIIRGFMLTVFGREGPASGQSAGEFVNKFVDPVAVHVLDAGSVPSREAEVASFVALLGQRVPGLRIRMTDDPAKARLFVFLVNHSNYRRVIADALSRGDLTQFMESSRCSSIMWNRTTGVLDHAYIFILADKGDAAFTSCLAEELTQSLGPANDNDSLVDSLYNDSNDVGAFGLFDWYILSALYDPAVIAGMNRSEAMAVLPQVIARLRKKAAAAAPFLAPLPKRGSP